MKGFKERRVRGGSTVGRDAMKTLIISPHIDDDVLGCGGIMDEHTMVLYCGANEEHIVGNWIKKRPSYDVRIEEADKVRVYLNNQYTLLDFKPNEYHKEKTDMIYAIEQYINFIQPDEVYIPHPSYNQDHQTVYDASLVAMRPHDVNYFVKKVMIYEQPQAYLWEGKDDFKPNYFVPINIDRKIMAYELLQSQVRSFRSPELLKAMSVVRGHQSHTPHAEAFKIIRWIE